METFTTTVATNELKVLRNHFGDEAARIVIMLAASKITPPLVRFEIQRSVGGLFNTSISVENALGQRTLISGAELASFRRGLRTRLPSKMRVRARFRAKLKVKEKENPQAGVKRLFRFVELFSRVLPPKVWTESFEPHFEDSKAAYLENRRRFKGRIARKWLGLCFIFWMVIAFFQSLGATFGEKMKKIFWAALGGLTTFWFKR
jgi:hypothetical protein